MASICDFVLIFVDCATLMGRSALSRRFLRSPFFGPATGRFDYLGTPTYFFNILYSKQSLHWLYSACKVWKSLDSSFLRYLFWKDFGAVVFGLKFRHFEFFFIAKNMSYRTLWSICIVLQCEKIYYDQVKIFFMTGTKWVFYLIISFRAPVNLLDIIGEIWKRSLNGILSWPVVFLGIYIFNNFLVCSCLWKII